MLQFIEILERVKRAMITFLVLVFSPFLFIHLSRAEDFDPEVSEAAGEVVDVEGLIVALVPLQIQVGELLEDRLISGVDDQGGQDSRERIAWDQEGHEEAGGDDNPEDQEVRCLCHAGYSPVWHPGVSAPAGE